MNDILQKTYDILERRGWCQGVLEGPDGRVCLEGAFQRASGYRGVHQMDSDAYKAWVILCNAVREETGARPGMPSNWNDMPGRTVEDVKLLLKKAIHADD